MTTETSFIYDRGEIVYVQLENGTWYPAQVLIQSVSAGVNMYDVYLFDRTKSDHAFEEARLRMFGYSKSTLAESEGYSKQSSWRREPMTSSR